MLHLDIYTNFSVDLHSENILRSRAGKLQGCLVIIDSEICWVTYLVGCIVLAHIAVWLICHSADDDDGVGIRGHRHRSAG